MEDGATLGEGTSVWHYAQVRTGAVLGDGCVVGKSAFIDAGVTVGRGCKIQNFATLYHGLTVGDRVFIGPSATFTNDRVPRAFNTDWQVAPTRVDDGASIGANATINCGLTIGTYAMVASGAVVTRDVPPHALVMGNPARVRGFVCECGERLPAPDTTAGGQAASTCAKCHTRVELPPDIVKVYPEAWP